MKEKVQNSSAIISNKAELEKRKLELIRSCKEKINNDTNSYLAWKKEMEERMDQKPLLLETSE